MDQKIKKIRKSRSRFDFCVIDDNQIVDDVYRKEDYVMILNVDNFHAKADGRKIEKI